MKTQDSLLGNLPVELAHALFRVAAFIKSQELKTRIEAWSIKFLESAATQDSKLTDSIHVLEKLVILGETVGEIPFHSSKVLYSQFEKIKSAIRQYEEEIAANSAIGDLFTTPEIDQPPLSVNQGFSSHAAITLSEFNEHGFDNDHHNSSISNKKTDTPTDVLPQKYNSFAITERQQLIVQKVRQYGNAAMKDLIAEFPLVSERTIRYDLQKLCEKLVLKRVGNGGPASFYHLNEQASEPIHA